MDIGSVVYTKNSQTGELNATWNYTDGKETESGLGLATGKAGKNYEGTYQMSYFQTHDNVTSRYTITIEKQNNNYFIKWLQNNEVKYFGIGHLFQGSLIAGWRKAL